MLEVVDDNRFAGKQGVANLRVRVRSDGELADHFPIRTALSPQHQLFAFRRQLHHIAKFDRESRRDQFTASSSKGPSSAAANAR